MADKDKDRKDDGPSGPGPGDPKWERDQKVIAGEVEPGTGDITPLDEKNTASEDDK